MSPVIKKVQVSSTVFVFSEILCSLCLFFQQNYHAFSSSQDAYIIVCYIVNVTDGFLGYREKNISDYAFSTEWTMIVKVKHSTLKWFENLKRMENGTLHDLTRHYNMYIWTFFFQAPSTQSGKNVVLLAARNVQKPQLFFTEKVVNTAKQPFVPFLTEKPNSLKPLSILICLDPSGLEQ